jgi:hypothetical protein
MLERRGKALEEHLQLRDDVKKRLSQDEEHLRMTPWEDCMLRSRAV